VIAVGALQELISLLGVAQSSRWMPVLREHSVVQCLLSTAATLMQVTSESID